MQLLLKHRCLS